MPTGPGETHSQPGGELAEAANPEVQTPQKPIAIRVVEFGDPQFDLAKQVEHEVFGSEFGDTSDELEEGYGLYDKASTFLLAVDQTNGLPVGIWRMIHSSDQGFKTVADVANPAESWGADLEAELSKGGIVLDPARTLDLGSVAIRREYRRSSEGLQASMALYYALIRYSTGHDIKSWIGILDRRPYEKVTIDVMGGIFRPIGELGFGKYFRSPESLPVYADVQAVKDTIRQHNPEVYKIVVEGRGLDEQIEFPEELRPE